MKSQQLFRTNRPAQGLVAFARAVVMKSLGMCAAIKHPAVPSSFYQLDRNEDRLHPGEGIA